jgi:hypothetical protein
MLCSSISRGNRTTPPILCDSSDANDSVGDFSTNAPDIAIDPNVGRAPIRAGRAVPSPIGYGIILRRATPNWEMSSRNSPLYCTGNGTSVVVSAVRVLMPRTSRANVVNASR